MAGRGRPPKVQVEEKEEGKEQSVIRTNTAEDIKKAKESWQPTEEKVEYLFERHFRDNHEKVKIRKISRFRHIASKSKETSKVVSGLVGVYKKYKGKWLRIGGTLPVERIKEVTGQTLK